MKKIIYIASSLVLMFATVGCVDKPVGYVFPKDEYFYDIPEVPVTVDYVVGVPYDVTYRDKVNNAWWNTGANPGHLLYTGNPLLGEYDIKADAEVLHQHLEWGKEAGINFFIVSWGGRGYNDTILSRWEEMWNADNSLPKVVIRFDPGYRFPKKLGDSLMEKDANGNYKPWMDSLKMDFDSVYQNIMMHNFGYKKRDDGKPVMVFTNFTNTGHVKSALGLTEWLRNSVNRNVWFMAELPGRLTSPERWGYLAKNGYSGAIADGFVVPDSIRAFDAFFITDISADTKDRNDGIYSFTDYNYHYWQQRMLPLGKEYIPTIMPSFDNLVNDPLSNTYLLPRWKEETKTAYVMSADSTGLKYNFSNVKKNPYQEFANVAKRIAGSNPSRIVIVYNWNSFNNGISLEPTKEYGHDYLKYTKDFFKIK